MDATTGERVAYTYWQAAREVSPQQLPPGVERKRITGSGRTESEALARLEENWLAFHAGHPTPRTRQRGQRRLTLKELYEEWQGQNKLRNLSDVMVKKYEGYFRLHILPALGHRRLDELQDTDFLLFLNQTLTAKRRESDGRPLLGAAGRRNIYKALATCLNYGVRKGHLDRSPLRAVAVPQGRRPDDDVQQVSRYAQELLAALRDEGGPDYCRWLFQFLGLRSAERLGLTWSCVRGLDTDAPSIIVRQQLARKADGGGWYIKPETKTRSTRTIVLPEPFLGALRDHRRAQDLQRRKPGWNPKEEFADLVFLQPNGNIYTLNRDNKEWARLLQKHGLPHWRGHLNRHITATWLAEQEPAVPMLTVQEILGHQSEAMNYYYRRTAELRQAEPMRRYGQTISGTDAN